MAKFGLFGKLFGKDSKAYLGDLVGNKIVINGKTISVDGKTITDEAIGPVEIKIIEGTLESVTSTAAVTVHGDVTGNVDAGMSVNCGNVGGRVDSDMSVNCGDVGGDVRGGMSVTARDITGNVDAGMSVNGRRVKG